MLQTVKPVLHAYHLPEWTLTVVVTLLSAGFPVTVVLAWVFDLTAKGVTRTERLGGDGPGATSLSRPRLVLSLLLQGRLPEARAAFACSTNPLFQAMGEVMVDHAQGLI